MGDPGADPAHAEQRLREVLRARDFDRRGYIRVMPESYPGLTQQRAARIAWEERLRTEGWQNRGYWRFAEQVKAIQGAARQEAVGVGPPGVKSQAWAAYETKPVQAAGERASCGPCLFFESRTWTEGVPGRPRGGRVREAVTAPAGETAPARRTVQAAPPAH